MRAATKGFLRIGSESGGVSNSAKRDNTTRSSSVSPATSTKLTTNEAEPGHQMVSGRSESGQIGEWRG